MGCNKKQNKQELVQALSVSSLLFHWQVLLWYFIQAALNVTLDKSKNQENLNICCSEYGR